MENFAITYPRWITVFSAPDEEITRYMCPPAAAGGHRFLILILIGKYGGNYEKAKRKDHFDDCGDFDRPGDYFSSMSAETKNI